MARLTPGKLGRTTWRDAAHKNRPLFTALRRLTELRASEIREHLPTQLRELLPKEWGKDYGQITCGKTGILGHYPPPPDDRFWAVITAAEELEQGGPRHSRTDDTLLTNYLRGWFGPDSPGPDGAGWPDGWREAALNLVNARSLIRMDAATHLRRLSKARRIVWEKGHEHCPLVNDGPSWGSDHVCGLAGIVHADGFNEAWVRMVISRLQQQQLSSSAVERNHATAILREVGKAISKTGSGAAPTLPPEERASRHHGSTLAVKAAVRAFLATERLWPTLNPAHFEFDALAEGDLAERVSHFPPAIRELAEQALARRLKGRREK